MVTISLYFSEYLMNQNSYFYPGLTRSYRNFDFSALIQCNHEESSYALKQANTQYDSVVRLDCFIIIYLSYILIG